MAVNSGWSMAEMVLQHRRKARLTRADLALLAGVGKTAIYDLEHGKLSLRWDTLLKILTALNITVHFESPWLRQEPGERPE